jgi:hypothetical protein
METTKKKKIIDLPYFIKKNIQWKQQRKKKI